MRKGAGISALQRHTATASSYSALASTLSSQQLTSLETSLASFREELSRFASLHGAEIRRDPAFRHQFQRMCAAIGIDPLAASGSAKPSWTCALALQVVDVCVSTRERNGGVIELGELTQRVRRMRDTGSSKEEITEEDVRKAIDTLEPLHAGYRVSEACGVTYVRTVPRELDTDQSMLLVLASETGGQLTAGGIQSKTGWSRVRAETALGDCVMREGMGWVDDVDGSVWLVAAVDFED